MKTTGRIAVLIAVTVLLVGCGVTIVNGSGKVITQSRSVANFTSVVLAGLGDVTITQGGTETLTIEAEDNVMPLIKTELKSGTLTISFDQKDWRDVIRPTKAIKFSLGMKNLRSLELSGAGNFDIPNLKTTSLTIKVSGAGNIKIGRLEATELTTSLTGLGNTELDGQVNRQQVEMSGAGQYLAGNLNSQTTKITVTGTGNATVWARDSLDVTIAGAGNVSYYGSPKVTKNITGVGILTPQGNK